MPGGFLSCRVRGSADPRLEQSRLPGTVTPLTLAVHPEMNQDLCNLILLLVRSHCWGDGCREDFSWCIKCECDFSFGALLFRPWFTVILQTARNEGLHHSASVSAGSRHTVAFLALSRFKTSFARLLVCGWLRRRCYSSPSRQNHRKRIPRRGC